MKLEFFKYHGTGNDFVLIDNRGGQVTDKSSDSIRKICDRHFGIGADGLILLEDESGFDFKMVYFNSDGNPSSMCGNGGRCITAFAKELGIIENKAHFLAIDGPHKAIIKDGLVSLMMKDVNLVEHYEDSLLINTGSPHYVSMIDDVEEIDICNMARKIRYSEPFKIEGINVNFISENGEGFKMRTYERGVEDETLSCGTGVTAAALAIHYLGKSDLMEIPLSTRGGSLSVKFDKIGNMYTDIWLTGPAEFVFKGNIEW